MPSVEEKRAALIESVRQLATHEPFKVFTDAVEELKNETVAYASSREAMENSLQQAAAMGEVRAYIDILAIISEHRPAPIDTQ